MKEKIIAAIKAKFPAVNLSKTRLDALAAKIEGKVTEESQIDAQIDVFNDLFPFTDIAKSDDTIADLKGKLKKSATPPKIEGEENETPAPADDTPAWAKALMDEVKTMRQEKVKQSLSEKLTDKLKDKDGKLKVPAKYISKYQIEKEEDLDTVSQQIEADYAELKQGLVNEGLLGGTAPAQGMGTTIKSDNIDADIAGWAASKKPVTANGLKT